MYFSMAGPHQSLSLCLQIPSLSDWKCSRLIITDLEVYGLSYRCFILKTGGSSYNNLTCNQMEGNFQLFLWSNAKIGSKINFGLNDLVHLFPMYLSSIMKIYSCFALNRVSAWGYSETLNSTLGRQKVTNWTKQTEPTLSHY